MVISFGKRKAKEGGIDFFGYNSATVDTDFKTFVKRNGGNYITILGERNLSGNMISLCMSPVGNEL